MTKPPADVDAAQPERAPLTGPTLRGRAEARLQEWRRIEKNPPATLDEYQRLVHELQVHQIELELQNEELLQARTAVERGLQQYTELYDFAPAGYFTLDDAGAILQANLTGARLLGVARSGLFQRRLAAFVAESSRPVLDRFLERVFSGQDKETCQVALLAAGPEPRWLQLEAARREHMAGFVVAIDISIRKQAEAALRNSQAQYQGIVDSALDAIIALDEDQRIITFNAAAERMFLCRAGAVIGQPLERFIPEGGREPHPGYVRAFGQSPLANRLMTPATRALTCLRANGAAFPSEISISHVEVGGRTLYTVIVRDITERKQLEDALHQSNETLEQRVQIRTAELAAANQRLVEAVRAKDDFLANMSHELRTPLTGILAMAEVLQQPIHGPVTPKQAQYAQLIQQSGEHLLTLINDVLELAKISAGRLELERGAVDVAEVCQAALHLVSPQANHKQLTVALTSDPAVTSLRADERRLKQVLVNLLGNAVKFTPAGGRVALEVTGDASGGWAHFTVSDTGIGIAADDLPRLFENFVQLDAGLDRNYEGTGLGLAMVRRLAELHGGRVTAESAGLGQGSRFTVSLPWSPAPPGRVDLAGG